MSILPVHIKMLIGWCRHGQTTGTAHGPSPAHRFFYSGLPALTQTSHREFSRKPFFPLEIMDGSDFQKISLNGAKLE